MLNESNESSGLASFDLPAEHMFWNRLKIIIIIIQIKKIKKLNKKNFLKLRGINENGNARKSIPHIDGITIIIVCSANKQRERLGSGEETDAETTVYCTRG